MKTTSGAVSNICYATREYAEVRLGQLQQSGAIGFWALVEHPAYTTKNGEERKTHLHIYIEAGAERVNLAAVGSYLEQIISGEEKPRQCKLWTRSNPIDWLAYSAHDRDYMRYKGLEKPYYDIPIETFATSDRERLLETWNALPRDKWKSDIRKIAEAIEQGLTFYEFADRNAIPMAMLGSVLRLFQSMQGEMRAALQSRFVGMIEEREPTEPEQLRLWTNDKPTDSPF